MSDNKDYVHLDTNTGSMTRGAVGPDINKADSVKNGAECSETQRLTDINPTGTQGDPPERGPAGQGAEGGTVRGRLPRFEPVAGVPAVLTTLLEVREVLLAVPHGKARKAAYWVERALKELRVEGL